MTLTCLLHSLVQMNMVKDTQSLKPVEVVFLTYLLGSALIILVFRTQLDVWIDQIVVRALALFLVIGHTLMRQSRFISFFRIFTPPRSSRSLMQIFSRKSFPGKCSFKTFANVFSILLRRSLLPDKGVSTNRAKKAKDHLVEIQVANR